MEPRCTGTKVCSNCNKEKHALAFSSDRRAKDGLEGRCRDCVSKKNKQYYRAIAPKFVKVGFNG